MGAVTIDAISQPGFSGTPIIEIDGSDMLSANEMVDLAND